MVSFFVVMYQASILNSYNSSRSTRGYSVYPPLFSDPYSLRIPEQPLWIHHFFDADQSLIHTLAIIHGMRLFRTQLRIHIIGVPAIPHPQSIIQPIHKIDGGSRVFLCAGGDDSVMLEYPEGVS